MKNFLQEKNNFKNQQGQALLFVIVALTIALSIGINVAVRTISSVSRTAKSDTSSRVTAAAEGGIERFLQLSDPELEDAASGTCPSWSVPETFNLTSGCSFKFDATAGGDPIVSEALVTVETYEPEDYEFLLTPGRVKEINLSTYPSNAPITICFDDPADIYYFIYGGAGINAFVTAQGGVCNDSVCQSNATYDTNGFVAPNVSNPSPYGFDACHTVSTGTTPFGLRLRVLSPTTADARVGVFSESPASALPIQGYAISSIGKLDNNGNVVATKKMKVVKTLPYLPGPFDFAVFSESAGF